MKVLRLMLAAFVTVLGLGWSSQALAWGDSGHRTVCEIALRNLTPVAKGEVARLLQAHPANPRRQSAQRRIWLGLHLSRPSGEQRAGPAQPGAFRQLSAHDAGRHRRDRLRRRAALRDHRDRVRLRHPAVAGRERPRQSGGFGLSRPLARRHPPAAAQFLRRRPRRQRGQFDGVCAPTASIRPGTPASCRAGIWAAARRSTGSACLRRSGAFRSATATAPPGSPRGPGNGRRNPMSSPWRPRRAIAY